MSAFTPTQWTIQPADRPEQLGAAVMQSLSRLPRKKPWRPVKTFILAGLSFGVWPLLVWPKRFDQFVVSEQQQFWHLVEWLRTRTGDPQAEELRLSVRNTGARMTVWLVPMLMLAFIAVQFVPAFSHSWFRGRDLIAVTYGYSHRSMPLKLYGVDLGARLFETWTICLSIAYGFHWLHVRQHATDVKKLVGKINALLAKENVRPVEASTLGVGLNPLWLIAAAVGVSCGAIWAIPAALAGAVQARYMCKTGPMIRGELADRVRTLLLSQRPPVDVPLPVRFRMSCPNPLCRCVVPGVAGFCPRCGTRVAAGVDRIA